MKKILIFESDGFLRAMYVKIYRREGFDVAAYENPTKDPVNVVLMEKPDIISMDVMMAKTNGFEATRLLKQDPRTRNIPVVILTNLGQAEDVEKGLALGASEYIIKASRTPSDVVSAIYKTLKLPIPKVQKTIPPDFYKEFQHPTVEPDQQPAQTVERVTQISPKQKQSKMTVSRALFLWLCVFALVGLIAIVTWLF